MSFGGILASRQPITNVSPADDQGRPLILFGFFDGRVDFSNVIAIRYVQHLPAIGLEALAAIFRERKISGAIDADAVVIVKVDQFTQFEVTRQ